MKSITSSLLFLIKDDSILLAEKKQGFGRGKWNGVGGKSENNESIEQTLIREAQEEVAITPLQYQKVAFLDFLYNVQGDPWHMLVHVYVCTKWDGEPKEIEKVKPRWFKLDDIPYEAMWEDDQYWLPLVLAGDKLKGTFEFDEQERMLSHSIQTVRKF